MSKLAALAIIIAILSPVVSQPVHASLDPGDPLLQEAMDLLSRIKELSKMEVNVTGLVHELNKSIALLQEGRREEARQILDELNDSVSRYEDAARSHYLRVRLYKYSIVWGLLSIPVLFYLLFPRIYLYLWFRWRRRWIVGGSPRR